MATELLYLRDAYLKEFEATVIAVDHAARSVVLDRTAFYSTGGGQPHDTGSLWGITVTDVRKAPKAPNAADPPNVDGDVVHFVAAEGPLPAIGETVLGKLDWQRRHQLMRTHTALHILCGVIWNQWKVPVTGGNMEPLAARMDFEFDPLPDGFARTVEDAVNAEIASDRPIEVSFVPTGAAVVDSDLIRTKVSLVPDGVAQVRVVDIVGLDRQADGGTHVRSTGEVGRVVVVKTESKGKGNKRIRLRVDDSI